MFVRLIPIVVVAAVTLISCGGDTTGPSAGSGPHISVTLENNSGDTLYVILNRADNYWLKDIGDSSSWSTSFNSSDCMVSVESGIPFSFSCLT